MKKFITTALLAAFLAGNTHAQTTKIKENRLAPIFLNFSQEKVQLSSEDFLKSFKSEYQLGSEFTFVLKDERADALGMTHKRYIQYVHNYPVEGGMLILHLRNNKVVSCNSNLFAVNTAKTVPAIATQRAFTLATENFSAVKYAWQEKTFRKVSEPKGELVWAPEHGNIKSGKFVLAYKFDLYAIKPLKKAFVFIDAQDGHVIQVKNRLMDVHTNGTGYTKYSGVRQMVTDSLTPGSYTLYDETRGGGLVTMDLQNQTSTGYEFESFNNIWNDTAGIRGSEYDVHWGLQRVYDYYDSTHNRQSYDGLATMVPAFVHFDVDYVNAFWDGQELIFGDGDLSRYMRPLTSLDIVGHEFTHGVTETSANLEYADEPGALNESFSDIFGKTIEKRYKPTTFSWYIGKEIFTNGIYMRSMANPKLESDPDTYGGINYYLGTDDAGGVHINSGVQNFWYYLLTNGKTGRNDLNNNYVVSGIGIDKAAAIAYRTLTVYLNPYSDYSEACFYSILAAKDLFGECSNELIQTTNAWYAVGVGSAPYPVADIVTASAATLPATAIVGKYIQLNSSSTNATSIQWFADALPSGTHTIDSCKFTTLGAHNITLIASNAVCSDTLTNAIQIQPNLAIPGLSSQPFFSVYPNPANGAFNIEGTCNSGSKIAYKIMDMTGKIVLEKKLALNSTGYKEYISMKQFASGIYNVVVTDDEQVSAVQVMIKN